MKRNIAIVFLATLLIMAITGCTKMDETFLPGPVSNPVMAEKDETIEAIKTESPAETEGATKTKEKTKAETEISQEVNNISESSEEKAEITAKTENSSDGKPEKSISYALQTSAIRLSASSVINVQSYAAESGTEEETEHKLTEEELYAIDGGDAEYWKHYDRYGNPIFIPDESDETASEPENTAREPEEETKNSADMNDEELAEYLDGGDVGSDEWYEEHYGENSSASTEASAETSAETSAEVETDH